ncbi:MAG TPA: hypothetical protein ENI20_08635 [Bacteroides sp.]|nr:hypothetical protein [Bacteroides sp.]
MRKNTNTLLDRDPLTSMLHAATKDDLIGLIKELIGNDLSVRRICIDHLKRKVTVSSSIHHSAESSAALSLWHEIEPELSELDEYGGGDYRTEDNVGDGLYQLYETLQDITLTEEDRDELLNDVFSYIESGNAGMDDSLYDITYATCKNDDHLRELAERFEDLNQDWPIDHARRIYRRIGDHKKYLELRSRKMRYGLDYYDLVSFYWDIGEHEKAIDIAQKGMKLAEGRMDELRMFLAEKAKEAGNRETYLEYYFDQKTHPLTLSSYQELEQECRQEEWERYEPKLVEMLKKNFNIQAVKIHMHRQEYDTALQYFKEPPRIPYYGSYEVFTVAEELEIQYPRQILEFYKSSIGNLNVSASRKVYSQNAVAVARVRRVLVDVMKKTDVWKKFAKPIKFYNTKRPAFQDEFARVIPDWKSL